MNKKLFTYLKDRELTDSQIKSILTKLKLNPEDKVSPNLIEKMEIEIELYKKPQKKIVIKRKKKIVTAKEIKEKYFPGQEAIDEQTKNTSSKDTAAKSDLDKDMDQGKDRTDKSHGRIEDGKSAFQSVKSNVSNQNQVFNSSANSTMPRRESADKVQFNSNKIYTYKPATPTTDEDKKHSTKKIFIKKRIPIIQERPRFDRPQFPGNKPTIEFKPSVFNKSHIRNKQKHTQDFEYRRRELDNKLIKMADKKKKELEFAIPEQIDVPESIMVSELAKKMNIKASMLIKKLFDMGTMVTINHILDADTVEIICSEFNCKVKKTSVYDGLKVPDQEGVESDMRKRPPVVTIMGHVDHGKTTLLDYIRKTKIVDTEAGGITQRIGAYKAYAKGEEIVFIDTPGHEAFTNMRARGANLTDIVVLVVAADDGVMPQTIEALNHAKQAKVPIIVAVNKIDKPGAKPDKVKSELTEHNIIAQEWGGENIFVNLSALKGDGIDEFLEAILLVSESLDLKADYNAKRWAEGVIIESRLDKGRGIVASVLVKNGILKERDYFMAGNLGGRIRSMTDEYGKRVSEAYPSTPVEVIGFEELPEAGSAFHVVASDKVVKGLTKKRKDVELLEKQKTSGINLASIFTKIEKGEVNSLKLIIKADLQGMAEALKQSLEKLSVQNIKVEIIHSSVGAITESDVMLAATSKAIIIGFNTKPIREASVLADKEGIEIRRYSIIYEVVDDIKDAISGMASPKVRDEIIGEVEIRQIFKVTGIGTVAGCMVMKGSITRDSLCKIYRDNKLVHEGKLGSLNRFKDAAKEVKQGFECGLTMENYNDIHEGDSIEAYVKIQEKMSFDELTKLDNKAKESVKEAKQDEVNKAELDKNESKKVESSIVEAKADTGKQNVKKHTKKDVKKAEAKKISKKTDAKKTDSPTLASVKKKKSKK